MQKAIRQLDNDLREVAKTEKVSPFILLIDRVCSYISLCCYTKDKQSCYNTTKNDYSLQSLYEILTNDEL